MTNAKETAALLDQFAEMVAASPHNLVSRRARSELRDRHIPECVAFAKMLPRGPLTLLDVGSGGGFPGLIIALMRSDLQVTLLEATGKKCDFLRDAAERLDVQVEVVHGRAEEVQRGPLGGTFDLCTARAVAPIPRLLGWTVPFLRPGGLLYAIKGARWREELDEAVSALRTWGAQVAATPEDLGTPDDAVSPAVVIIRRVPERPADDPGGNH